MHRVDGKCPLEDVNCCYKIACSLEIFADAAKIVDIPLLISTPYLAKEWVIELGEQVSAV